MAGSKKIEMVNRKFKMLNGTRNTFEFFIWCVKELVIAEVCGGKGDTRFQGSSDEVCL